MVNILEEEDNFCRVSNNRLVEDL